MTTQFRNCCIHGLAACWLVLSPSVGFSAALSMSNTPLFTTTAVEPNVFFMVDDSLSMESDQMTTDANSGGKLSIGAVLFPLLHPVPATHRFGSDVVAPSEDAVKTYNLLNTPPLHADAAGVWRGRNHHFNKIYYNPDVYYEPWQGLNTDGSAYPVISDPHNAPWDPYEGSAGLKLDLTVVQTWTSTVLDNSGTGNSVNVITNDYYIPRYFEWTDSNGNGSVDANDGHVLHEIRSAGCSVGATCSAAYTRAAARTDCSVSGVSATCSVAQELQNFANWWSYHRSRDKVVKAALSEVIARGQNVRMGLATTHNNSSQLEVASMNAAINSGNKAALLQKLFAYRGRSGGTPLRAALERAGNYFACNTSAETTTDAHYTYYPNSTSPSAITQPGNLFGNNNCPIVSVASGGACQQNFTVLLTDGFDSSSGAAWRWEGRPAAPADADWGSTASGTDVYLYNDPFTSNTAVNADANSGGAYADSYADTLADVAMHFYETDLSALANDVPTQSGVDENNAQHMVTFGVSLGLEGTLNAMPSNPTQAFTWPNPSAGNLEKIDDLRHAAYNSRGKFFDAQNPSELITALNSTVRSISDRVGAASAVAFNTTTLSTDTEVYLALFNSTRWSGDLVSYGLDPNTGIISSSPTWHAADELDGISYSARNIFSFDGNVGMNFTTYANLTTAQQADLNMGPSGSPDALGEARMNYIRGSRSDEDGGNYFRLRASVLGDIVHSGPVYVGHPNLGWGDAAPFPTSSLYSDFKNTSRAKAVYVGANDGMLHAFNAQSGAEMFAYIPNFLFSAATNQGLHYLTDPAYSHNYYVDMTPTVSDIYDAGWKTVLVGAVRSGARGIFALDVTQPGSFDASKVLFEFTSSIDSNLGYSFSRPVIAMTNAVGSGGEKRWAAIFGNGYNSGGSSRPALFILFLDNDLSNGWQMGSAASDDYLRLDVPANAIYGDSASPNGLSSPAVVDVLDSLGNDGANGTADRVYAGDLLGNLWSFNIADSNPANWAIRHQGNGVGGAKIPLFNASLAITSSPVLTRKPGNASALIVMFGSGRYIAGTDPADTSAAGFYGVYDAGTSGNFTSSNLTAQTLSINSGLRMVTDANVANNKEGWYIALSGGERVVTDPVVRGQVVYFNTTVPSAGVCDAGGSGWLMSVDFVNGGTPSAAIFDRNSDEKVNSNDLISGSAPIGKSFNEGLPATSTFLGNRRYTPGTETGTGGDVQDDEVQDLGGPGSGRLSWEQLKR